MRTLIYTIPKLAIVLSNKSVFEILKLAFILWYFILTRKILKFKKAFPIPFLYKGSNLILYLRYSMDIAVLKEVFLDKEYEWFPIENPEWIIDLGAHFGDTALYYHTNFPDAKIIAVEPSPENFQRLVENTKLVKNIVPVQAAIGSIDGEIELNIMPSSLGHSTLARQESTSTIKVQQITLDTLFSKYNIDKADIIKFDIEGAEYDLFGKINPSKYSYAYIGEVHADLVNSSLDLFEIPFNEFFVTRKLFNNKNRMIFYANKKEF